MPIDDSKQVSGWTERTPADLSSLMVEIGRVAKAVPFYGADSGASRSLAERACRALQADLGRSGPLELEIREGGFEVVGVPGRFGADHLGTAVEGLQRLGVQRLRFTEVVSTDSLVAFIDALGALETQGRPSSQLGIEVDGEICVLLGSNGDAAPAPETADSLGSLGSLSSLGSLASLGSSLLRSPAPPSAQEVAPDEDKPDVEDPCDGSDAHPDARRLFATLRELERCTEDDLYIQLAANIAGSADKLYEDRRIDESIRAMLVLGDHAAGEGGRSAVQARVALGTLQGLATGERLGELIDRACSNDTGTSVQAAQLLLSMGEQAVPELIERLAVENARDADGEIGDRAAQITGLLIALGERAIPALMEAMASGRGSRARLGIRIAGELQCPALAKPLRDLLCAKDGPLQKEAARALVEMGNSIAVRALLEALESKHDRTSEIAAFALGTLGLPRSRAALVRRLARATQDRSWTLAREILQGLGQFQEGDRATARALLAWVRRGGAPWRRPDLELKLEAVTTLGQLSGPDTTLALREISRQRLSPRLCERAARILDRRGDGQREARSASDTARKNPTD